MSDNEDPGLPDLCAKLTEGQRVCLRLVRQHKTSKEIAIILNISHHTVDQRVVRACNLLGVRKRTEAALLLEEFEDELAPDQFIYKPPYIEEDTTPAIQSSPTAAAPLSDSERRVANGKDQTAEEEPHDPKASAPSQATSPSAWFWKTTIPEGDPNAISPRHRITWIVRLMVQIVVSLLVLVAIGQVLSTFADRAWPDDTEIENQ